jgi:hypothetical protein
MPTPNDYGLTIQAKRLLEEIRDQYKSRFRIKRLAELGELGRILVIDRHYDKVTLSSREREIEWEHFNQITHTSTETKSKLPPHTLSPKDLRLIDAWIQSDLIEQNLGTSIHCCLRIINRKYSKNEAAILWRIACEQYFFAIFPPQDERESRQQFARLGAESLHSRPGGSREKKREIQRIWASGKYSSRDICAEEECAALGMSFSTARKALRGTPTPLR